jgi:hypothetical protein
MRFEVFAIVSTLFIPHSGFSQDAAHLGSVRRLFVGSFGEKPGATALRDNVAALLSRSHTVTVVNKSEGADGVLDGTGEVWVKGHYSLNPRQREVNADSQPIYGGYLSVELKGKGDETLWSYLVTPHPHVTGDIHKDLAGHVVKKLLEAIKLETIKEDKR